MHVGRHLQLTLGHTHAGEGSMAAPSPASSSNPISVDFPTKQSHNRAGRTRSKPRALPSMSHGSGSSSEECANSSDHGSNRPSRVGGLVESQPGSCARPGCQSSLPRSALAPLPPPPPPPPAESLALPVSELDIMSACSGSASTRLPTGSLAPPPMPSCNVAAAKGTSWDNDGEHIDETARATRAIENYVQQLLE